MLQASCPFFSCVSRYFYSYCYVLCLILYNPNTFFNEETKLKEISEFLSVCIGNIHYFNITAGSETLMSPLTLSRRTLSRFRSNHSDNSICWDRNIHKDSFFSGIDANNHFRPYGGEAIRFKTYLNWMQDAGVVFSTMSGVGQRIQKVNKQG